MHDKPSPDADAPMPPLKKNRPAILVPSTWYPLRLTHQIGEPDPASIFSGAISDIACIIKAGMKCPVKTRLPTDAGWLGLTILEGGAINFYGLRAPSLFGISGARADLIA